MHNHLDEGDGGNADVLEVVGVFAPWRGGLDGFLLVGVVAVEGVTVGVDELDGIFELCYR